MAKKRNKIPRFPVKSANRSTLKKTLKAVTDQKKDQLEMRKEFYAMADKAVKEEMGSMREWFRMARLEHKAMKRILIDKGICTEEEISQRAEEIKGKKRSEFKE